MWAAEAGGPRYGRFFGFIVAWWSTTAWTTFCASTSYHIDQAIRDIWLTQLPGNTQSAVNYMLSVSRLYNQAPVVAYLSYV